MSTSFSSPSPGNDVMNDIINEVIENGRGGNDAYKKQPPADQQQSLKKTLRFETSDSKEETTKLHV